MGLARHIVVGQEQLSQDLDRLAHPGAFMVGLDDHVVLDLSMTGGHESAAKVDRLVRVLRIAVGYVNDAESADRHRRQMLTMTEDRDRMFRLAVLVLELALLV